MAEDAKNFTNGATSFATPDSVLNPSISTTPVPIPYPNNGQSARELPATIRHQMESAFNADLSQIRVHENHGPTLLGAQAFTSGQNIFLAPGEYQPNTDVGQRLIAHECAHVIQQGGATVNDAIQEALNDNVSSDAND